MARTLNQLTALQVKNATPGDKPTTPRLLADGGGLYLQITPQGSKSFLFRYTLNGKAQAMGLGPTHAVSLAEAREAAQKYRKLLAKGLDPKAERTRSLAAQSVSRDQSFMWCAEQYMQTHRSEWKNEKHVNQWTQTLEQYAYPHIGPVSVGDIDVHSVLAVLEPIWRTKTETASRLRGRIERILGWATVKGYRKGENPARWKAYLSEMLPKPRSVNKITHHPAIKHQEIAGFLHQLRQQPDSVGGRALEFLTLTAARTHEVIGARWTEIDFETKRWTVPAERMKAKRQHVIPLNSRALEILTEIKKRMKDKYVFPGRAANHHISNMALLQVMRRMKREEVPHGMRSTFRDWAADHTDFPREIAEAALAHVSGDQTEAAYLRSDRFEKRRAMMDAWGKFCCGSAGRRKK